jgi:hypothetical protein
MAKGKPAADPKAVTSHDPVRGRFLRWVKGRLGDAAAERETVVAVAGRTLLRVFPILGEIPGEGDEITRELVAASWESVRLAAEVSGQVKHGEILMDEAKALYRRFIKLTPFSETNKSCVSRSAWSVGTAAWQVTNCMFARDFCDAAGKTASEALDAAWQSAGDDVDVVLESFRLRAAIDHDIDTLVTAPSGEGLMLAPLWPQALGEWPRWYQRYREWLTTTAVWQTLVAMLDKDSKRRQEDPALQKAFDAFDGAKLPGPPLTKLTGLTPDEGLEVLRCMEEYLDRVAEPVVNVVRLLFSDLRGQSFTTLEQTKEFTGRSQSILDRTEHEVECSTCGEPGRLVSAPRSGTPAGVYRVRHGVANHGGSKSITELEITRKEKEPR